MPDSSPSLQHQQQLQQRSPLSATSSQRLQQQPQLLSESLPLQQGPPPIAATHQQQHHWLPAPAPSSGPEFVRGALAAVTAVALTFPLNKLISRQAYEGLTVGAAADTLRADGLRHLYRGVAPPLVSKTLSLGLMYGAYDWYTLQLCAALRLSPDGSTGGDGGPSAGPHPTHAPAAVRVVAALLAGATEAALTPFERVQTILQHRHYTDAFTNAADVAAKIARHGPREFYRGASAILLRNGPSNAIFFMLREPARALLPAPVPPPPSSLAEAPQPAALGAALRLVGYDFARDFFAGALLGAGISTLFYPLNLAKSVMQLNIGGRHSGVLETLRAVYDERRGLRGVYRGVSANALRSLLSWGIVNASYEVYRKVLPPPLGGGDGPRMGDDVTVARTAARTH